MHVPAATKGHFSHGTRLGLIWSKNHSELWLVWMSGPRSLAVQLLLLCTPWQCSRGPSGWGTSPAEVGPGQEACWGHPVDFGSCLCPDLVPFGVQASIPKDIFEQKMFTAFRCGLVWKAQALAGKQPAQQTDTCVALQQTTAIERAGTSFAFARRLGLFARFVLPVCGRCTSFELGVSLLPPSPCSPTATRTAALPPTRASPPKQL